MSVSAKGEEEDADGSRDQGRKGRKKKMCVVLGTSLWLLFYRRRRRRGRSVGREGEALGQCSTLISLFLVKVQLLDQESGLFLLGLSLQGEGRGTHDSWRKWNSWANGLSGRRNVPSLVLVLITVPTSRRVGDVISTMRSRSKMTRRLVVVISGIMVVLIRMASSRSPGIVGSWLSVVLVVRTASVPVIRDVARDTTDGLSGLLVVTRMVTVVVPRGRRSLVLMLASLFVTTASVIVILGDGARVSVVLSVRCFVASGSSRVPVGSVVSVTRLGSRSSSRLVEVVVLLFVAELLVGVGVSRSFADGLLVGAEGRRARMVDGSVDCGSWRF